MAKRTKKSLFPKRSEALLTWVEQEFLRLVAEHGGFYNAHAHLCRAATLEGLYLRRYGVTPIDASYYPLSVKQHLVGNLHDDVGYTEDNLRRRMSREIERQIAFGVTRLDTNIDATPDLPEDGLLAIRVALELKEKYKRRINIRIAPTPIFGFKQDPNDAASRWEVFEAAAKQCDYLSLLPEKDDYTDPVTKDGRVGFERHMIMGFELACKLGMEVPLHVDQTNLPTERGTELLLEGMPFLPQPKIASDGPAVWVIHMISPSSYDEERFARLMDKLLKFHVGVIICPTAALSMRQLRPIDVPMHNSIARVPELAKKRIPIRLGTDNIADVFVPWSDGDMLTEIKAAANATRMASPSIWAKLATGTRPNNVDIITVGRGLYEDRKASLDVNPHWKSAIE